MWKQVSHFTVQGNIERLWHAGLSPDGSRCFLASSEDTDYLIWDITEEKILFNDDGASGDSEFPSLEEWIQNGSIQFDSDQEFNIFGLNHNNPILINLKLNQVIQLNHSNTQIQIIDSKSKDLIQAIQHDNFSGDWSFASFSENGSTLAILTPYDVMFYRWG